MLFLIEKSSVLCIELKRSAVLLPGSLELVDPISISGCIKALPPPVEPPSKLYNIY